MSFLNMETKPTIPITGKLEEAKCEFKEDGVFRILILINLL
jgi:hypothetical protein